MLRLFLLLLPAIAGAAVMAAKPADFVVWVNDSSAWWDRHYAAVKARKGLLIGIWRALIWGFHKLHQWTQSVADDATRAGIRTALFFYIGGLSLAVIATAIYLVVVVAVILVGIWIVASILGAGSGGDDRSDDQRSYVAPRAARRGRSRRRKDWLGEDYEEHLDEDGRPIGRSRVRQDWLGDTYVERRNADGEVEETSRHREDWLGEDYVEHRGADGERTGESRDRETWLGEDYVEHRDAEGEETGRSVERRDWLGEPYTEHEPRD